MRYDELVSRSKGIIPVKVQNKIKKCKIFLLGCGLGSQIAVLATQMGFKNFILIDGDAVEVSNLNRQSFRKEHIGRNKAEVTHELIKEINSRASVESYPIFLKQEKLARKLVDQSDVIVNMADPEKIMYFINNYAQKKRKIVLFPLNLVWGGYVLAFTKNSVRLTDIVGKRRIQGNKFYLKLLKETFSTFPPKLLELYIKKGKQLLKSKLFTGPQLGVTAYLTSAMVVQLIVRWLSNEPIRKAPTPFFLDLWEEVS